MTTYEVLRRLVEKDFTEGGIFVGHSFCTVCTAHLCRHGDAPSEPHTETCPIPYLPGLLTAFVEMRAENGQLSDEVSVLRRRLAHYEAVYGVLDRTP